MYIYLVTYQYLKENRVGSYKNLNCYIMNFGDYRENKQKGYIFGFADQAIDFMLERGKL